jgi:parallel beta-helix repeat protein
MRRALVSAVLVSSSVALMMVASQPAFAASIDVFPGDSIQAAVNKANPGDTIVVHPGVYHESVVVKKNGLDIQGSGASDSGTVLRPPTQPQDRCLHGAAGFCVFGHVSASGPVPVVNVHISGFKVRGFRAFGMVAFGARGTIFAHNVYLNNGEYGGTAFNSVATSLLANVASGSGEAGFYIGDSPTANAIVRGNRAFDNGSTGFLFRDASHAVAHGNRSYHNCTGMTLLNTGAPGGVHAWHITGNHVYKNNRFCKGGEAPPLSGTGIGLIGARNNVVKHNNVWGNQPSGPGAFPGGIVLQTGKPEGGSQEAGNRIVENHAHGNKPADIVWDGKGRNNRFVRNDCGTSDPNGLCD